jgi:hypothetical protein
MRILLLLSLLCASTAWIVKRIFNAEQSGSEEIAFAKTTGYYQMYRKIFFIFTTVIWCMGIVIFIFTADKSGWIAALIIFLCSALTFISYVLSDRVFKNKAPFIARNADGVKGLPLCAHNGILLINRTFICERVPLKKILWIHSYRVIDLYAHPTLIVCFRLDDGGKIRLLINPSYMMQANAFINNLKEDLPALLVSRGFFNAGFKECRNAYKHTIKSKPL